MTWPVGSQVAVNWINPIRGNVTVMLESNIGGPTYVIAPSVPAISQEGYCDSGAGVGVVQPGHECGMVQFVVPDGWERMNNCEFSRPLILHPCLRRKGTDARPVKTQLW